MNVSKQEFWNLAKTNREIKEVSLYIEENPICGIGSQGGGRVLVCEYCRYVKYIDNKHQQFCSRKCRYDYINNGSKPILPSNPDPIKGTTKAKRNLTRKCGKCGKEYKVRQSRLKTGQSIYCSIECARQSRGLFPVWYTCNVCGISFRAVDTQGSKFCCLECASQWDYYKYTEDGKPYNEPKPKLVDFGEDFINHKVNEHIQIAMARNPKLKIDTRLRVLKLYKVAHTNIDHYYLTASEREQMKELRAIEEEREKEEEKRARTKRIHSDRSDRSDRNDLTYPQDHP